MRLKQTLMGAVLTVCALMVPNFVYGQAYGTVGTETLNVRAGATTDAAIIKQLDYRDNVEIVDELNGWVKIVLPDDSRGYVKADYLSIHRAVSRVNASGLNVRDYPSKYTSKIIGKMYRDDEISVHAQVGDFYQISHEGFNGYVHKDYVEGEYLKYLPTKSINTMQRYTLTQQEVANSKNMETASPVAVAEQTTTTSTKAQANATQKAPVPVSNSGSSLGQKIVSDAKQFLGNPYVYGGNSLTSGVDCSGFTQQIMKRHGVYISRSSASQYANDGYSVSASNLQPGDLVFYGYNGRVSHVGIYIGNSQVIHSNDERTGIIISNLYPKNGKPYIGAKRVV